MPKGAVSNVVIATSAVKLREMIFQLETSLGDPRGQGAGVLDMLKLRDQIDAEVKRLQQEEGLDLRPERTRIETIDNILMRKAALLNRELRSVGGLAGARRQENPPEEHWWWYLDLYLAEKQRKTAIRMVATIAIVAIVLVAINFILNRLSGLSPQEKEARGYGMQAEQYLAREEYDKAIAAYEQALATLPSYHEAYINLAVLYELKGETDKAQAAFASAEAAYSDRTEYLLALGRAYQSVRKFDVALTKIEEALKLNPNSVQGYLLRGGIYESMNKTQEAIADYEKAANMAQEQRLDALYVIAKTRMAMLLQRGPGLGGPGTGF